MPSEYSDSISTCVEVSSEISDNTSTHVAMPSEISNSISTLVGGSSEKSDRLNTYVETHGLEAGVLTTSYMNSVSDILSIAIADLYSNFISNLTEKTQLL
jgi:hypothetical protein